MLMNKPLTQKARTMEDLDRIMKETAFSVVRAISSGDITASDSLPYHDGVLVTLDGQLGYLNLRATFEPKTTQR